MIGATNPAIQKALAAGQIAAPKPQTAGAEKGEDFAQMLMDVMKEVNQSQHDAKQAQEDLLTGRRQVDYHDVMIAAEKASTSMQLTMAVRNKLLEAFQEINRMQV